MIPGMYLPRMRRALWIRIVTATWGLWLGVALSQPMMLQSCPMHSGHTVQDGAMAGMPGMAGGTEGALAHHGTAPRDASTTCTCLSDCCCMQLVLTPTGAAGTISDGSAATYAAVAPACDAEAPVVAAPYALPFANGPPASGRSI
jgi:hypothetical protein